MCGRSRSAADSCFLICRPDLVVPSAGRCVSEHNECRPGHCHCRSQSNLFQWQALARHDVPFIPYILRITYRRSRLPRVVAVTGTYYHDKSDELPIPSSSPVTRPLLFQQSWRAFCSWAADACAPVICFVAILTVIHRAGRRPM